MKRFTPFLFSLFLMVTFMRSAKGQVYESIFGLENTSWKYPFCNLDQAEILERVSNETIALDNVVYHRIGTPNAGTINYSLVPYSGNALVREDLESGRVWYTGVIESFQGFDTVEYLIMDLSLQEGESFIVHEMFGDQDISVVDSVYYLSGLKHVRTTYQHWASNFPLTFIEGVGTNYGLAYMHDYYNLCSCLLSLNKDDEEVYMNNACNPSVVSLTEQTEKELRLAPNPATNKISISNLSSNGKYVIIDILGSVVKEGYFHENTSNIDINALKNNIYFIKIEDKILKFIKN